MPSQCPPGTARAAARSTRRRRRPSLDPPSVASEINRRCRVGGVLNPEGVSLLVTHAIADLIGATSSSGASLTVGFSSAAASTATTLLFDTLTSSVAGVFSNASSGNAGTGGVPAALWSSGGYLTVTLNTAHTTAFNMNLVVEYEPPST